jgi:hypothetical protein
MGGPNEPRLMEPRGDGKRKPTFDHTSGNAARDGFTVIASREPPRQPGDDGPSGPFGFSPFGGDTTIHPQVGSRDYRRGRRIYSED